MLDIECMLVYMGLSCLVEFISLLAVKYTNGSLLFDISLSMYLSIQLGLGLYPGWKLRVYCVVSAS